MVYCSNPPYPSLTWLALADPNFGNASPTQPSPLTGGNSTSYRGLPYPPNG